MSPRGGPRSRFSRRLTAMWRLAVVLVFTAVPSVAGQAKGSPKGGTKPFTVVEATIPELRTAMEQHRVTSREIVLQYLVRIALYEDKLNAVITVSPDALREADERDRERAQGQVRGPLHGIPIALKDNIHTTNMPTTGGALAFDGLRSALRGDPDPEPAGRGRRHRRQDDDDRARQLGGERDARELQRPQGVRHEPVRPPARPARGHVRRPPGPLHRADRARGSGQRRASGRRTSARRRRAPS